ncbi:MAG: hypothetical protein LKG19_01245 [Saprospiraceae bacterium]|jgi:hypothetical protein|nr:hypothetical protein [Saprospiraceae bacterium]
MKKRINLLEKQIISIILFLIINSCRIGNFSPIDYFFDNISVPINSTKEDLDSNLHEINFISENPAILNRIKLMYYDSLYYYKLNEYLLLQGIIDNVDFRIVLLSYIYRSKLLKERYDFKLNIDQTLSYFSYLETLQENRQDSIELLNLELMHSNNQLIQVGDLLKIVLPTNVIEGQLFAEYGNMDTNDNDCLNYKDSLIIKCRLMAKKIHILKFSEKIDTADIEFDLIIQELSKKNIFIFREKYKIHDTLKLHLSVYCKKIFKLLE